MNYNPEVQKYLEALKFLSQTTEDYLYVWDVKSGDNWFFGKNVSKEFNLKSENFIPNTKQELLAIVCEGDKEELFEDLTKIKNGEKKLHDMNYRWITKDGKAIWQNCCGKVIDDEDGNPMLLVGIVSRTVLKHRINNITGMYNRRVLLEDVRKKKFNNGHGVFMLLGLDRLAKAYSQHSREHVESLVEFYGDTLETFVNDSLRVYHVEDDVFALYMENATPEQAQELFDDLFEKTGDKITVTGLALVYDKMFVNEIDMYKTALNELAKAKKNNRSKLTFLVEEDIKGKLDSISLLEELNISIANGFEGFYVKYQPQIRNASFDICGVEALMRFRSVKTGKEYSPVQFIPLMEQAGLMKEAGLWILGESLKQLKKWRESLPELTLNVNFSLAELKQGLEEIIKLFKQSGLPQKSLTIEITETVSTDEVGSVSMLIRTLKESGINIAIDDFGTGYANLALLKEIKCDEIKIEKMFVTGVKEGSYGFILINSLIGFARNNDIKVCCEGVETEEDVLTLSRLKPDSYQGFVFDKPCLPKYFEECYIDTNTKKYKQRKKFLSNLVKKDKEHIATFNSNEILSNIGIGLCIMCCDFENKVFETHPDAIMETLLGMPSDLSPLECNKFWFSRIKDGYEYFVKSSLTKLIEGNNVVQFAYPWIHPEKGEILLSFSGIRAFSEGNKLVVKCLFRVVTDIERLSESNEVRPLRNYVQNKYLDTIIDNAIGFMEINLSQNRVEAGIKDLKGIQPESNLHDKSIYHQNGSLKYDEFEKWWADGYLISSREEFLSKCNCQSLIDSYSKGHRSVELYCRGVDKNGAIYDCRKVFYISRDEIMGDITALCVMYDVSDKVKKEIEKTNKDNAIRSMCDEFRAILYVNLDEDTVEFYREDDSLGDWKSGLVGFDQTMSVFADKFVSQKDKFEYKFFISRGVIKSKLQTQDAYKFEYERKCSDGSFRYHQIKIKRDLNNNTGFYAILGVKDIDDDIRLKRQLKNALDMAYTDHLTGLFNQQGLHSKCSEILKDHNGSYTMLFMDIDNFKQVNDIYGHGMGDKILYEVGKVLKEEIRGKDVVGRYGGDEFVALICDGKEHSEAIVERIKERIAGICEHVGLSVKITASIGLSFSDQTGYDYRHLKEIADDRLYLAKKHGKNKIVKNS